MRWVSAISVILFAGMFAWLGLSSRCARLSKPRPERLHHEVVSQAIRLLSKAAATTEARTVLLVRVYGLEAGVDQVRWQAESAPIEVTLYDGGFFYGNRALGKVLELVYAGSGSPLPSVSVNGLPVLFETSRGENLSYADNWSTSHEVAADTKAPAGPYRWRLSHSAPETGTLLSDCVLKRWKRAGETWTCVELTSE